MFAPVTDVKLWSISSLARAGFDRPAYPASPWRPQHEWRSRIALRRRARSFPSNPAQQEHPSARCARDGCGDFREITKRDCLRSWV